MTDINGSTNQSVNQSNSIDTTSRAYSMRRKYILKEIQNNAKKKTEKYFLFQ